MPKTWPLRLFSYFWGLIVIGIILTLVIGKSASVGSLAEWLDWGKTLFSRSNIGNWLLALVLPMPAIGTWLLADWLDQKAVSRRR